MYIIGIANVKHLYVVSRKEKLQNDCYGYSERMTEWKDFYHTNEYKGVVISIGTQNAIDGLMLDRNINSASVPSYYDIKEHLNSANYISSIKEKIIKNAEQYGIGFDILPSNNSIIKEVKKIKEQFDNIMTANEISTQWISGIRMVIDYGYYGLLTEVGIFNKQKAVQLRAIHPLNCYWDANATRPFKEDGDYCGFTEKQTLDLLYKKYKNTRNKEFEKFYKELNDIRESSNTKDKKKPYYINVITHFRKEYSNENFIRYENFDDIAHIISKYNNEILDDFFQTIKRGGFKDDLNNELRGILAALKEEAEKNEELGQAYQELLAYYERPENAVDIESVTEITTIKYKISKTVYIKGIDKDDFIILENEYTAWEELPLAFCGSVIRTDFATKDNKKYTDITAQETVDNFFDTVMPLIVFLNRIDKRLINKLKEPEFIAHCTSSIISDISKIRSAQPFKDLITSNAIYIPTGGTSGTNIQESIFYKDLPDSIPSLLQLREVFLNAIFELKGVRIQDSSTPQDPRSNLSLSVRYEQMKESLDKLNSKVVNTYKWSVENIKNSLRRLDLGVGLRDALYETEKYKINILVTGGSLTQKARDTEILNGIINNPAIQQNQLLATSMLIEQLFSLNSIDGTALAQLTLASMPKFIQDYFANNIDIPELAKALGQYNEEQAAAKQSEKDNATKVADAQVMVSQAELMKAENDKQRVEIKLIEVKSQIESDRYKLELEKKDLDMKELKFKLELLENEKAKRKNEEVNKAFEEKKK